jgi:hypothetical protein
MPPAAPLVVAETAAAIAFTAAASNGEGSVLVPVAAPDFGEDADADVVSDKDDDVASPV